MKTGKLITIAAVLLIIFAVIFIVSPRVGEVVEKKGEVISFTQDDNLPDASIIPKGFVRCGTITDSIVYSQDDGNGSIKYYEYIGDNQFTAYDLNRPSYLVKSSKNKKLYQVKDINNNILNQYRYFDEEDGWIIVNEDFTVRMIEIPKNYFMSNLLPNLYYIKSDTENTYKLLKMLTDKSGKDVYVWTSIIQTSDEIKTEVPNSFAKTSVPNVYSGNDESGKKIYKLVIKFDDKNITAVDCDENGKIL